MQESIHLDVETFSAADLKVVGAYRYARDPSTEVLIACYQINDGPVKVWLPYKHPQVPADLKESLERGALVKAHNAEFEREIWRNKLAPSIVVRRSRWRCSAVRAAHAGLPRSLDRALAVLGHSVQKDKRGRALIQIFCKPRKPTKKDASVRIRPEDRPVEFQEFIAYCQQDVKAEHALDKALPDLTLQEWKHFHFNMLVNDRGLPLDMHAIAQSAKALAVIGHKYKQRVRTLTSGINPTQRDKLMGWLKANGHDAKDMQLKTVVKALKVNGIDKRVREVLELRLESSKASVKKIKAMGMVAWQGRAHGTMLFYGAHTGRLSGRLIQPHNFTRGLLTREIQDQVLRMYSTGDHELVEMLFPKPIDMLAQSMRGFIRAPDGKLFYIADYAAIETRILAWLAGEKKVLDMYRRGLDTYKMMAMVLYHVGYDEVDKEQRRIGKNLRLGAGFQLGVDGLLKNCAKEEIEMTRDFAQEAIRVYREDNPHIVSYWYAMQDAALAAMAGRATTVRGNVHFARHKDWLTIELASGRRLWYYKPEVKMVMKWKKMRPQLSYYAEPRGLTKGDREHTYGGKLTENVVQATAWDIMINGMLKAEEHGYPPVASVHDEILTLRNKGEGDIKELEKVICMLPDWAKGLPLEAEGFVSERYHKG